MSRPHAPLARPRLALRGPFSNVPKSVFVRFRLWIGSDAELAGPGEANHAAHPRHHASLSGQHEGLCPVPTETPMLPQYTGPHDSSQHLRARSGCRHFQITGQLIEIWLLMLANPGVSVASTP